MSDLLAGKTGVVTGAASGNGRGIALAFAEHGADVVVADLRSDPIGGGTPTHELIQAETESNSVFVECDATSRSDLQAAIDAAGEFGGLDILVNNVGASERGTDFLELSDKEYDKVLDINLRSTVVGSQLAVNEFKERGGGNIINISSVSGLIGDAGAPIYSASKGGVRQVTYALAARFGDCNVRVNAIHPGLIRTPAAEDENGNLSKPHRETFVPETPLGRAGRPEDVGDAAVFLASDMSSFVTGESLVVDGGFSSSLSIE